MEIEEGRIGAIVTLFIAFIVVSAVVIPIVLDLAFPDDSGSNVPRVGEVFEYEPETNFDDAIISVSGSAMDYGTFRDGIVEIEWEETGEYTLIVTATTSHPYQTASQTITFNVQEAVEQTQDNYILLVIPTVLIVGLLLYALRRVGGMDTDAIGETRIGGDSDFFSGSTRGFGKR